MSVFLSPVVVLSPVCSLCLVCLFSFGRVCLLLLPPPVDGLPSRILACLIPFQVTQTRLAWILSFCSCLFVYEQRFHLMFSIG